MSAFYLQNLCNILASQGSDNNRSAPRCQSEARPRKDKPCAVRAAEHIIKKTPLRSFSNRCAEAGSVLLRKFRLFHKLNNSASVTSLLISQRLFTQHLLNKQSYAFCGKISRSNG